MKSVPKKVAGIFLVLSAIVVPEIGMSAPAAYADSEASSSAGSQAGLEAGVNGRGRRRGRRRGMRQNGQMNKQAQKSEQEYRARTYTGDHR